MNLLLKGLIVIGVGKLGFFRLVGNFLFFCEIMVPRVCLGAGKIKFCYCRV